MSQTLSFSPDNEGWPSFYSYQPEFMIGMNGYFYSFDGGNIWLHNDNAIRNNFYGRQYNSQIEGVFNDAPLERKLYQNLATHSTSAWDAVLQTDLQSGYISDSMFERKELTWYGFVRAYTEEIDLLMRRAAGLSTIEVPGPVGPTYTIELTTTPSRTVSVGDFLFYADDGGSVIYAGTLSDWADENTVIVDSTVVGPDGSVATPPTALDIGKLLLYVKDSTAESHGVLGNYCTFTLTNSDTVPAELFAVDAEVMKSYA
jgi:hypothetical protein